MELYSIISKSIKVKKKEIIIKTVLLYMENFRNCTDSGDGKATEKGAGEK